MTSRYKRQSNDEQIECFEAQEVLNTFQDFVSNFKTEHDEKLQLQEKVVYLEETNKIYKEKIQQQQTQRPIIVGGGNKQLEDFINQIAEIKMKRCNITENDLIEHRNKILKELENNWFTYIYGRI